MKPQITDQQFEDISTQMVLAYAATASPKVLHQMASQWNGDHVFLEWLANNPETDKGTAFMIYWMSEPRWWKQYRDKQHLVDEEDPSDGFDFSEGLEEKLLNGFYKNHRFAFDPTKKDDGGTIWADELKDIKTIREIPDALYEPLPGEKVEDAEDFEEGMPPDLVQQIQDAYDGYEII